MGSSAEEENGQAPKQNWPYNMQGLVITPAMGSHFKMIKNYTIQVSLYIKLAMALSFSEEKHVQYMYSPTSCGAFLQEVVDDLGLGVIARIFSHRGA